MEVPNPELYQYDGEVLAKAEEMGKPGLVDIKQKQVWRLLQCPCAGVGVCVWVDWVERQAEQALNAS